MTKERLKELECGDSDKLTPKEVKNGWRFCNDCDGLVININTHSCPCLDNGEWDKLNSK